MKINWKWIVGALLAGTLLVLPFAWQTFMPYGGMMRGYGYGYGMHMPYMMNGFGMSFGMIFLWLIPLGLLVLIGLGIAWLVKQLIAKPS